MAHGGFSSATTVSARLSGLERAKPRSVSDVKSKRALRWVILGFSATANRKLPLPKLSSKRLDQISRADLKALLAELLAGRKPPRSTFEDTDAVRQYRRAIAAGTFDQSAAQADVERGKLKAGELQTLLRQTRTLSRNSIRLVLATARVIFNHAAEDGLIQSNPAAKLDRFAKTQKHDFSAVPLTRDEAETLLESAREFCPRYYPLFLTSLRAGLRRGELVALKWGDIQFGASEQDHNRNILVQRNYVYGQFTTPKSKKPRRVDLSRQMRATLLALRDERLLEVFLAGKNSVSDELVFPAPEGGVLDPDHLYDRYFLPVLEKAGLRRIRFHDLRHTFGYLLIQAGASLPYIRDQLGHSSIQVTADVYGHLLPGANVECIDKLDATTSPQLSATQTQPAESDVPAEVRQLIEKIGAGGDNRTYHGTLTAFKLLIIQYDKAATSATNTPYWNATGTQNIGFKSQTNLK